jgi:hypothetical protein
MTGQPLATETLTVNGVTYTAVASGPAVDEFAIGSDPSVTADNLRDAIKNGSDSTNVTAWSEHPTSQGTLTLTGTMSDGDTFTVGSQTFIARTTPTVFPEFTLGASASETVDNIVAAFNQRLNPVFEAGFAFATRADTGTAVVFEAMQPLFDGARGNTIQFSESSADASADGSGFLGGTRSGEDIVRIEWLVPGTAGNSVTFTEALTNATIDGAGFLGGTRSGSDGKTTPDYTFSSDRYFEPTRLSISGQDIRNAVRGTFMDRASFNNDLVTVVRDDPVSIARYGRRYMEVTLASTDQIDTIKEMDEFLQYALNDLSEPDAEFAVPVQFFWPVESDGDLYRFTANSQLFDTDQDLAIASFAHDLRDNRARTTLTVRGKPAGGVKRWMEIEGNNLIASAVDLRSDNPSDNALATAWIGGAVITYDDPRGMRPPILDWKTTRVHVSETPGFTPHSGNLIAEGRTTRFVIESLDPTKTYEAAIQIVDENGNVGTTLRQSFQPEVRGPLYDDRTSEFVNLVPNGEFGRWSPPNDQGLVPPDNWIESNNGVENPGNWGSDATQFQSYFDLSTVLTGGTSIRLSREGAQPSAQGLQMKEFSLASADEVHFYETMFQDTASTPNVQLLHRFYDSAFSLVQTEGVAGSAPVGAGVWYRFQDNFRTVTTARWFKSFFLNGASASAGRFLILDRVRVLRSKSDFLVHTAIQSLTSGAFTKITGWTTEPHDHGNDFDLVNDWFKVPHDGTYQFSAAATIDNLPAGDSAMCAFHVNSSETVRGNRITNATGGPLDITVTVSTVSIELNQGDQVDFRAFQDSGGALNTIGLPALTYFTGSHVK